MLIGIFKAAAGNQILRSNSALKLERGMFQAVVRMFSATSVSFAGGFSFQKITSLLFVA